MNSGRRELPGRVSTSWSFISGRRREEIVISRLALVRCQSNECETLGLLLGLDGLLLGRFCVCARVFARLCGFFERERHKATLKKGTPCLDVSVQSLDRGYVSGVHGSDFSAGNDNDQWR